MHMPSAGGGEQRRSAGGVSRVGQQRGHQHGPEEGISTEGQQRGSVRGASRESQQGVVSGGGQQGA